MDYSCYPNQSTSIKESAAQATEQPPAMRESESNMEFTMVQSPGTAEYGECIYAVVSKETKNRSSAYDRMEYSKMGLNGLINGKPSAGSSPWPVQHDVYATLDEMAQSTSLKEESCRGEQGRDQVCTAGEDSCSISSGFTGVVDGVSHRYKFPAVFLGSIVVDLKRLEGNKNEYLLECIQSVAAQNSEATTMTLRRVSASEKMNGDGNRKGVEGSDVTLSTHRGMNVVIVLEEGHVKVKEKKSNSIRLDIPLTDIRMWGKGKGNSSREFAIISRDPSTKVELCRVFLCEVVALTVVAIFKEVCVQLTLKRKEVRSQSSSKEKTNLQMSDNLKKFTSVANIASISTVRSNKSEGSQPSNFSLRDLTSCHYLGMMEVDKPTGTKIAERAIDMVHSYVPENFWQAGKLMATPDGICFLNDGSLGLSCPNNSITFVAPSLKHNNLVGITVKKNNGIFSHIFAIEGDLYGWFENVKFVCKLHSTKFDKSVSNTLNKRSRTKKQ